MTNSSQKPPRSTPPFRGEDRRRVEVPDRRKAPRGGRRVTDAIKRIAGFAYKLLTEPPK